MRPRRGSSCAGPWTVSPSGSPGSVRGGAGRQAFLDAVQSIAQVGRSVLLHMVVATQRPEAAIVPGAIKGNLATRIALQLPTAVDSMTVFQRAMAEKLPGIGDMFYWPAEGTVERLQGYAD